jgi:hypothetical protein
MSHQLQRLFPRHYQMIELFLQGVSNRDIAAQLDMTTATVANVFNSGLVQQQLARRRKNMEKTADESISRSLADAQALIEQSAVAAAQVHVDLLESSDQRVKQSSANAILDRAGMSGKQADTNVGRVVIEADVVNLLNIAAKESLATIE